MRPARVLEQAAPRSMEAARGSLGNCADDCPSRKTDGSLQLERSWDTGQRFDPRRCEFFSRGCSFILGRYPDVTGHQLFPCN